MGLGELVTKVMQRDYNVWHVGYIRNRRQIIEEFDNIGKALNLLKKYAAKGYLSRFIKLRRPPRELMLEAIMANNPLIEMLKRNR